VLIKSRNSEERPERFKALRQWLNIIFMVGAVAGMAMYFYGNRTVGTIVIVAAMVLKFVECILRLMK
jgi:hypothetical protein